MAPAGPALAVLTSTRSSSPSTDLAVTLESPDESTSEVGAVTISRSVLSAKSVSCGCENSGHVEKEAIFSRILRRIASSLRDCALQRWFGLVHYLTLRATGRSGDFTILGQNIC